MIPDIDFGGSGPSFHFAHANGYPLEKPGEVGTMIHEFLEKTERVA